MKYLAKFWWLIGLAYLGLGLIDPLLCALVLGLTISGASGNALRRLWRIRKRGEECIGTVVDVAVDSDGDKTPVISFTAPGAAPVTGKPSVYASTDLDRLRSYRGMIGRQVRVRFDPDDPEQFILSEDKELNFLALAVFLLAGLAMTAGSSGVLLGLFELPR